MVDVSQYTGLITSEHADKPKFNAMVSAVAQCFVDQQNALGSFIPSFDLDEAVGDQLDTLGAWVGISRRVRTPLTGVYFSFDIAGLGFDQGVWQGPFDPSTGITLLDDDTYRLLIRAKIGANHWDGTLVSSAAILNLIFQGGTTPRHLTATNELFATADGIKGAFQLSVGGIPVYSNINVASIYRNDWQGNQLLYATARTNILTFSEDVGHVTPTGVTITSGQADPRGGITAWRIQQDTSTGLHFASSPTATLVASTLYYLTSFFSAGQTTKVRMQGFPASIFGGTAPFADFDLVAGTVAPAPNVSATIQLMPDGSYKCVMATTAVTAGSARIDAYLLNASGATNYTGDGISGLVQWGRSISSSPGSYIPTTTAAVTLTDYTVGSTGIVTPGHKPVSGAQLTWNGSGDAYPGGTQVFIEDHQDMSISFGVAGKLPSALFLALLSGGYIPIKPEGVRVRDYVTTSVDGDPIFGFDMMGGYVAGFDVGAWGTPI